MFQSKIVGCARSVGSMMTSNEDVCEKIKSAKGDETTPEWIWERTGIKTRNISCPGEYTSVLATRASQVLFSKTGYTIADIDMILVATCTPDFGGTPATANMVQKALGGGTIPSCDLNAACSGFVYALAVADAFIRTSYQRILVIGCDMISSIVDWKDRTTAPLLGDGAGAVILERTLDNSCGIQDIVLFSQGNEELLIIPAGGSRKPASLETIDKREHFLKMRGRDVFKFAIEVSVNMIEQILKKHALVLEDIDLIFFHSANIRISQAIMTKLKIQQEKVFHSIDGFGNTSAASIPIGLSLALERGFVKVGQKILFIVFGGGLTWGICYIIWG